MKSSTLRESSGMFPEYIPSTFGNPNKYYNIDSHNLCENFFYNVTRKSDNK